MMSENPICLNLCRYQNGLSEGVTQGYIARTRPLNNLTFGGNTNGSLISPGVTTLTQLATSSGLTLAQPLLSLEMDVRQTMTSMVPEPAMLSLMSIGLLGLGFMRRRRAQK